MTRKIQTLWLILPAFVWPSVGAAEAPQELEPSRSVCLRCAAAGPLVPQPAGPVDASHRAAILLPGAAAREHTPGGSAGAATTRATVPSRKSAMGWGIAIGIGGGVGVAGVAASRYGNNEGGAFCTRCFVQWSAVSIPVGAGVGAAVGYLIDRARR